MLNCVANGVSSAVRKLKWSPSASQQLRKYRSQETPVSNAAATNHTRQTWSHAGGFACRSCSVLSRRCVELWRQERCPRTLERKQAGLSCHIGRPKIDAPSEFQVGCIVVVFAFAVRVSAELSCAHAPGERGWQWPATADAVSRLQDGRCTRRNVFQQLWEASATSSGFRAPTQPVKIVYTTPTCASGHSSNCNARHVPGFRAHL